MNIAGQPILRHVMEIYAGQGYTTFVLAAGFRAELIDDFARHLPADWSVDVVDTGEDTNKGDRVLRCRDRLRETFCVTYGDGVGDVDIDGLLTFHRAHTGAATVTVVPLPSQYGTVDFDAEGRIQRFDEKPQLRDHWINAGFMAMDERVFDLWSVGDLETEVLSALATSGELFAHRHEGFWKSMDTFKDAQDLTALAETRPEKGWPPWLRSAIPASS